MSENEPTPETLVAPLARPVPRPGATAATPPPNRVPTMPPRPSPAELTRSFERQLDRAAERQQSDTPTEPVRPAIEPRPAEPVRFGEFGRAAEPTRVAEPARTIEPTRNIVPEAIRRPAEPVRAIEPAPALRAEAEVRQLIVGKEITLRGEITHCDRLLIEGSVEANLSDCRDVDIAESGLFKGAASIESAEIRGRFEGTLTLRQRLFIRATGMVIGTIRYGQIEVERGGRIAGDIESTAETASRPEVLPQRFG